MPSVQWGLQGSGSNWDVYYPIAVNMVLTIVAIDAGATANDQMQVVGVNPSTTNFKTYSSIGNNFKLALMMLGK